jgi:hypothetical protein
VRVFSVVLVGAGCRKIRIVSCDLVFRGVDRVASLDAFRQCPHEPVRQRGQVRVGGFDEFQAIGAGVPGWPLTTGASSWPTLTPSNASTHARAS